MPWVSMCSRLRAFGIGEKSVNKRNPMHDDSEEQLFEGQIEISNLERGGSLGIDEETYFRMAQMAMTASGLGIEPAVICKLPDGQCGCKLILFGRTHAFSVVVRVLRSSTTLGVSCEPLDGLHCTIPLYEDEDNDANWSRALRSMCAVEGIAYYDQHWAAEQQGEQGEGH
jgi:hypothetical protein